MTPYKEEEWHALARPPGVWVNQAQVGAGLQEMDPGVKGRSCLHNLAVFVLCTDVTKLCLTMPHGAWPSRPTPAPLPHLPCHFYPLLTKFPSPCSPNLLPCKDGHSCLLSMRTVMLKLKKSLMTAAILVNKTAFTLQPGSAAV